MRKLLSFLLFLTISQYLTSQKLIRDFGNNHITTSAIVLTPDGKQMIIGCFAKSFILPGGQLAYRTCWNNPFEQSWTRAATGRVIDYMNAPSGTLIVYSKTPGSTASDGNGNNGLYTSAIPESIRIPDMTILQMVQNVRSIVSQQSGKQQVPWESTSLTGDFYFIRSGSGKQ